MKATPRTPKSAPKDLTPNDSAGKIDPEKNGVPQQLLLMETVSYTSGSKTSDLISTVTRAETVTELASENTDKTDSLNRANSII